MLRDRFVCIVNHQGIQRKLLFEDDFMYESALKLALTVEASERDSKKLRSGENSKKDVHYLALGATHRRPEHNMSCYRCGGLHLALQCKPRDATGHYCKNQGHLAVDCWSKAQHSFNDTISMPHSSKDH